MWFAHSCKFQPGSSTGFFHDAGQQSWQIERCLSFDSNWFLPQFGFGVFLQTLPSSLTVELWGKMVECCYEINIIYHYSISDGQTANWKNLYNPNKSYNWMQHHVNKTEANNIFFHCTIVCLVSLFWCQSLYFLFSPNLDYTSFFPHGCLVQRSQLQN